MKILLLERDPNDSLLIHRALESAGHQITQIETSEQAWAWIQQGEAIFLIGDWDTSDLQALQFIPRARRLKLAAPLYIMLLRRKEIVRDPEITGADDIMHKPFSVQEFMTRFAIGERIIALSGSLTQAEGQLENLAIYDPVTGLLNQAAFHRQAAGELERARRVSAAISLVALKIDNFRRIGEVHGSQRADEVLNLVGLTIREKSRPYDCIGRLASDEFMIALAGVIGPDAEKIAGRIIGGLQSAEITADNNKLIEVHLSAGVASASHISSSTEMEPLIVQARQALARASEAGEDQIRLVYL